MDKNDLNKLLDSILAGAYPSQKEKDMINELIDKALSVGEQMESESLKHVDRSTLEASSAMIARMMVIASSYMQEWIPILNEYILEYGNAPSIMLKACEFLVLRTLAQVTTGSMSSMEIHKRLGSNSTKDYQENSEYVEGVHSATTRFFISKIVKAMSKQRDAAGKLHINADWIDTLPHTERDAIRAAVNISRILGADTSGAIIELNLFDDLFLPLDRVSGRGDEHIAQYAKDRGRDDL